MWMMQLLLFGTFMGIISVSGYLIAGRLDRNFTAQREGEYHLRYRRKDIALDLTTIICFTTAILLLWFLVTDYRQIKIGFTILVSLMQIPVLLDLLKTSFWSVTVDLKSEKIYITQLFSRTIMVPFEMILVVTKNWKMVNRSGGGYEYEVFIGESHALSHIGFKMNYRVAGRKEFFKLFESLDKIKILNECPDKQRYLEDLY